jgi:hypothetical protein
MSLQKSAAPHRIPTAPLASVYHGRKCVGFVLSRGRSGFEAFNHEQRALGLFKTAAAAANAVSAASANVGGAT